MALDEISPFRPRWSEERAFKRLYCQWANSTVLHFRVCLKLVDVDMQFLQGPPHYVGRLQRGCSQDCVKWGAMSRYRGVCFVEKAKHGGEQVAITVVIPVETVAQYTPEIA